MGKARTKQQKVTPTATKIVLSQSMTLILFFSGMRSIEPSNFS